MNFSVIIATRNRAGILGETLGAFKMVDFDRGQFEIIVADDGSTDSTSQVVRKFIKSSRLNVVYLRLPKVGVSAARNRAIRLAKGEYLLFINDDVIPASHDFLSEHMRTVSRTVACVGHFDWHPSLKQTEVMKFLSENGPLFNFNAIKDKDDCGPRYFITANISVHRGWLREDLFDERHPFGMEDNELGYRLCKKGLVVRYNRRACGLHHHQYDSFKDLLGDMRRRNSSYNYLVGKNPEVRKAAWRIFGWGAVAMLCFLAYAFTGSKRIRNKYWSWQMGYVIRKRW